jgi:dolichol-phosphate mannosyltransferase
VLIALATYNEIENLPELVDAVLVQVPGGRVVVVDDNSPDGTGDWVRRRVAEDDRVHGIHRAGKLGLGTATIAAMQYAIEHDYDLLVTMDADWSHDPKYIPGLLAAMAEEPNAVIAIGSRYVAGGGTLGWPWFRRIMSRVMNGYARWLLGLTPRDCTGAFRCYRVQVLREVDWGSCQANGYAFLEEILCKIKRPNRSMLEVPIVFCDRQKGETKLGIREAARSVVMLLRIWRAGAAQE